MEQDETEGKDEGFGDDFDDFEEGEEGEDDFGDFDDGLQQPNASMSHETQANYPPLPSFVSKSDQVAGMPHSLNARIANP